MVKRQSRTALSASLALILSTGVAVSQDGPILFTNVDVFDGVNETLMEDVNVVVTDNLITQISSDDIAVAGGQVIDGGGRTLMPGLSDTHAHITWTTLPQSAFLTALPEYNAIHSAVDAENMLMRGFTSVRDMGGASFGLKQAIDQGLVPGPRIYPSGGPLSQTAGHGDFRFPNQTHPRFGGDLPPLYKSGDGYLTDGVPQVLAAARENLRHGASQIKLMAGGGYSSPADPLLGNQFTFDEIKAAVDTAADWGTYVTIHAYHKESINRAIDAGVKDIGHGQLLDKETLQRMADEGVFLSTQPFTVCSEPQLSDFSNAKLAIVCEGTAKVYQWAKEIPELKVTYGTDLFFVPSEVAEEQAKQMERLLDWFEPVEILRMATSNAGELFAMSGDMRNPYLEGTLGLVAEGNYADLLLVEGNPLEDLGAVTDSDNIKIIMKDGVIYKNTLE
ncbi:MULTISPECIES: metal-dependent hydrolase family protein [Ruegeria]|uniref:N-ethylammeline chlorohydrolase n=2 Tax=Ruegeria arenilitoris TaxID=1173585 RepID=A0A238L0R5_9RHOB|nr:amidohydrolase family protein [Ruegeria profundi]MCA0928785.1 amidohydrolase family protein [Ruegeria profundi]SMX48587.1 N-ethylammeline chlorohydrolase [Ruegeria arenilitoris]